MIRPRIGQCHSFRGDGGALAFRFDPQPLTLRLGFPPEIALGDLPMSHALKHLRDLPIR
jgi:hypothetical protein